MKSIVKRINLLLARQKEKVKRKRSKSIAFLLFALPHLALGISVCFLSVQAQSIVPATDGTGTIVKPNGTQYDIQGGTTSADNTNLFHSFTQFGLSQGEIANFISSPSIQNILGRVTGGDPSVINGLLQVSGGNSNLFLMNPAGIVFGAGASLNVPRSFTATTATGIQFDAEWFNAIGSNSYAALVGTPNTFAFATPQTPGAIVNEAQLAVKDGQDLNLLGGTVVSLGNLSAPGGSITVASVPGEKMVRLSQAGSPLSLEIQPLSPFLPLSIASPLSLPQLLTGGGANNATKVMVSDTGEVKLAGSNIRVDAGDVVVQGATAQTSLPSTGSFVDLASANNITVLGKIDTSATSLGAHGGSVTMSAFKDINILSSPLDGILTNSNSGNGGNIFLTSKAGSINVQTFLNSSSNLGNGGAITLSALDKINNVVAPNNSPTGTINIAGSINSSSNAGNGGAIALLALNQINAGVINSSSAIGNGGSVTLDPLGDIQVTSINAQGGTNGVGGNVNIATGQFFQATGTFLDQDGISASISTSGGIGGGAIAIQHGGGDSLVPFLVGNPTTNGTAGALNNGQFTISTFQAFPGPDTQGNLQLITADPDQTIDPTILIDEPDEEPPKELPPDIPAIEIDAVVTEREEIFTRQFAEYFGLNNLPARANSLLDARQTLARIERETGVRSALMYVAFVPKTIAPEGPENRRVQGNEKSLISLSTQQRQETPASTAVSPQSDELEVVLVTAEGSPLRKRLSGAVLGTQGVYASRSQVLKVADQFRQEVIRIRRTPTYLTSAKQLYQWLIAPLEGDLQARGIQNLVFVPDSGLRSVPFAALYDGQQFLVEKYSVSLIPSLSLTDTLQRNLKSSQVLAMGVSKFPDQAPLPAVPTELSIITPELWPGKSFLNNAFTLKNLKTQRRLQPFRIVHLATHAEFEPGDPTNSYIQLWDSKLSLNQLSQLDWNDPPVDLLVLSACRTALGDEQAELGFAGLAVQTGAKSALASLWYVSDQGTLGLMTEFYQELKKAPVRVEALRQAQVAMLKGQVRIQGGKLQTPNGVMTLTPELAKLENQNLSHPYYWAAFTMIGNPW
ncbi:CHAT domain-containing protein [Coleofasciculus sp. FACHB-1120]|uniref:CHAT domain-containing protein n=1 Tax=Coleofasciculus sp. FACHB-1120 TaxID=2692783 RepID=UPI0016849839|nr:CHAT domain-containing protein [Coleofasciculus sp. FACHB-1120]MBD2740379.1 CHAT domain-containing protein [Coleofasciculus sp. FACHB-1120]